MNRESEIIEVKEPSEIYKTDLLFPKESYEIIGCCFEVHKNLGCGFTESVYKDALAFEFRSKQIPYDREKRFGIRYKTIVIPRSYVCDFVVYNKIVLEIKAQPNLIDQNIKQTLNYLAVTEMHLGILVHFGESSLKFKRMIL